VESVIIRPREILLMILTQCLEGQINSWVIHKCRHLRRWTRIRRTWCILMPKPGIYLLSQPGSNAKIATGQFYSACRIGSSSSSFRFKAINPSSAVFMSFCAQSGYRDLEIWIIYSLFLAAPPSESENLPTHLLKRGLMSLGCASGK